MHWALHGKTPRKPHAICRPTSTEQVVSIVALCNENRIPLTVSAGRSGVCGAAIPVYGGVVLDTCLLASIISVDKVSGVVEVLPGMFGPDFENELRDKHSVTVGHFPQSFDISTIGGWVACRGAGQYSTRYGKIEDMVVGLEVVLANGTVVYTGTEPAGANGPDLTSLFVGSEGTLGVITEITLRLYPLPEAVLAAVCSFPSIEAAVRTTITMIQMGVPIARVELIDANAVRMVNAHSKLQLAESPMLLMEFHGSPASVKEQAETVQEVSSEFGGQAFEWATTPEDRTRLWTARHNTYFAGLTSRPGCRVISTDTCVPISRLADCLLDSIAEVDASGIPYFLVGHVGDGNFHFGYLIDPDSAEERATAETLNNQLVARALSLDGTCTGEHGIGLHKMDFLVTEAGAGAVSMMRTIKQALDPKNIMNPGKIF
jgi:D-lactate dehydrogenase (cytochrome)